MASSGRMESSEFLLLRVASRTTQAPGSRCAEWPPRAKRAGLRAAPAAPSFGDTAGRLASRSHCWGWLPFSTRTHYIWRASSRRSSDSMASVRHHPLLLPHHRQYWTPHWAARALRPRLPRLQAGRRGRLDPCLPVAPSWTATNCLLRLTRLGTAPPHWAVTPRGPPSPRTTRASCITRRQAGGRQGRHKHAPTSG